MAEVDDDEIERRLRRFADAVGEESPVSEPRPAQTDDIVVIDILGPEDKWPFDAEHSQGVRFRIGQDGRYRVSAIVCSGCRSVTASVTINLPADIGRDDLAGREKLTRSRSGNCARAIRSRSTMTWRRWAGGAISRICVAGFNSSTIPS